FISRTVAHAVWTGDARDTRHFASFRSAQQLRRFRAEAAIVHGRPGPNRADSSHWVSRILRKVAQNRTSRWLFRRPLSREEYSLPVCLPVWNRPDLFEVCYQALRRQLEGIDASIWIFDNGSDAPTRDLIAHLEERDRRLFKVTLPQNMGIPFVANIFGRMITQDCEYVDYRSPTHVMLADADGYFKGPIS